MLDQMHVLTTLSISPGSFFFLEAGQPQGLQTCTGSPVPSLLPPPVITGLFPTSKEYSPQAIFHNENEKQRLNGSGTQFRKPATEVAPEARLWFQYPPAAVPPTGLCSRAHEPTRQEGAGAQGIRVSGPPRGQTALKLHVPAPVGTHVTLGPPAWRSPCPDGHSLVAGLFSKLAFCPSPSPHLLLLLCLLRPPVLSGDLSCPLRCLRSSASCFPGQLNQNPGGGFRH
ncbi:actin-associated protein FAM107A isoform X3 [Bubalus kerabau]|uniref:actin-associated protein FAM107A isoform X3 n=1 Tax=Bubalus carabanensis TaxID=3119969 RepID=UPI00244EEBF9|nr:actin-associated protein FAM107A isoform X3 [Bubalus carabanensis]